MVCGLVGSVKQGSFLQCFYFPILKTSSVQPHDYHGELEVSRASGHAGEPQQHGSRAGGASASSLTVSAQLGQWEEGVGR